MPTVPLSARNDAPLWWGLLATTLLGLGLFNVLPALLSLAWVGLSWDLLLPPQWVGWGNVQAVLGDAQLPLVLANTGFLVLLVALGVTLGSAVLAWQLFWQSPRWQLWLKAAYFIPYITPSVAVSLVFGFLLHPQGVLNQSLVGLHLLPQPISFLQHPQLALVMIALLDIWKLLGYNLLLLLAGLQQLPSELFEAADMDACPRWQQSWRVALPNLKGTLLLVLATAALQALQTFDSVYLLTQGGPNGATTVLAYWIFKKAFLEFNTGQASVIALLLLLGVIGIASLRRRFQGG